MEELTLIMVLLTGLGVGFFFGAFSILLINKTKPIRPRYSWEARERAYEEYRGG